MQGRTGEAGAAVPLLVLRHKPALLRSRMLAMTERRREKRRGDNRKSGTCKRVGNGKRRAREAISTGLGSQTR